MLNANVARASGLRVGGASLLRWTGTCGRDAAGTRRRGRLRYDFPCIPGGEVIRVQIGGDDLRPGFVKFLEIGDDPPKGSVRRLRLQIADMLTDEDLTADRKRHDIF